MGVNTRRIARNKNKKFAKNEFTALTGVRAIQVQNPDPALACLVTEAKTIDGLSVAKHAYILYHDLKMSHPTRRERIRVTRTCNTANCVARDHLIAHDPLKDTPPGLIF